MGQGLHDAGPDCHRSLQGSALPQAESPLLPRCTGEECQGSLAGYAGSGKFGQQLQAQQCSADVAEITARVEIAIRPLPRGDKPSASLDLLSIFLWIAQVQAVVEARQHFRIATAREETERGLPGWPDPRATGGVKPDPGRQPG